MRLAQDPTAATEARRYTRRWSGKHDLPEAVVSDLELVVDELVTNAVLHADGPIDIELSQHADVIRGQVSDASPVEPTLKSRPDERGGFGLRIVDSRVARWGSARHDDGKYVWFELKP